MSGMTDGGKVEKGSEVEGNPRSKPKRACARWVAIDEAAGRIHRAKRRNMTNIGNINDEQIL